MTVFSSPRVINRMKIRRGINKAKLSIKKLDGNSYRICHYKKPHDLSKVTRDILAVEAGMKVVSVKLLILPSSVLLELDANCVAPKHQETVPVVHSRQRSTSFITALFVCIVCIMVMYFVSKDDKLNLKCLE